MAAGLMGCAKEIPDTGKDNTQKEGVPMTFNLTVLETKAAKTAWADGDKIYVFFNGLETKYLTLTYDGSSWANDAGTLVDTDFEGLGTRTLTAVHFPVAVDVSYAGGKFFFTSGGKPVYNYYLYETGKEYSVDGTKVTATLAMGKPADMVQIHVAGIEASVSDYTFGCTKIKPVACASVGTDGAITESVLQAGARLSGIADSDGAIFAGRLEKPGVAADYKFTVASDTHLYTLTRPGRTLTAGKMYNFPAPSVTGGNNWTATAASELYVDLGLSVKWAKCNLGAATETEAGDFFAWGELQSKADFSWGTYLWGNGSSFSKYTGSDYTVLQKEDDAAYAALGGKWRMPTKAEIEELYNLFKKPPWDVILKPGGSYNNKPTYVVFKDKDGTFEFTFPLSGRKSGATVTRSGEYAYFWSSSLSTNNTADAWSIYAAVLGIVSYSVVDRYYGQPVRPVWSE